jgi:hypothetical protein
LDDDQIYRNYFPLPVEGETVDDAIVDRDLQVDFLIKFVCTFARPSKTLQLTLLEEMQFFYQTQDRFSPIKSPFWDVFKYPLLQQTDQDMIS